MQVARAATNVLPTGKQVDGSSKASSYAPLYLTSTLGNTAFDIEELETIALDRLRVLKSAQQARSAVGGKGPASRQDSVRSAVRAAERLHGLNVPPHTNPDRDSSIMKDEASHFLLRLALCGEPEHRTWLLSTECDLFSTRLDGTSIDYALRTFSSSNGPRVEPASSVEVEKFRAELDAVARGPNRQRGDVGMRYYKVPFEEVPTLVRHRRVFLRAGIAFVPERNVMDIVVTQFRAKLSAGLAIANRAKALVDKDQRLGPILTSIKQHFAASETKKAFDPSDNPDTISLNELNDALPSMPLCMANMMQKLREQHHLRHSARMQLGVFLKGCGLTMDESLKFWKTEFGKGDISSDKFEKNYAYNIRHHYGKEGKRQNLTPFACMRVINERPGPNEHHGCPYREFQEMRLKHSLRRVGVAPNAVDAIASKAAEGNFQIACGMCFAASQPGPHGVSEFGLPEFIPSHPNEYFIEARRRRLSPATAVIDEEIDDEEMIIAAETAETLTQSNASLDEERKEVDDSKIGDSIEGKNSNELRDNTDVLKTGTIAKAFPDNESVGKMNMALSSNVCGQDNEGTSETAHEVKDFIVMDVNSDHVEEKESAECSDVLMVDGDEKNT